MQIAFLSRFKAFIPSDLALTIMTDEGLHHEWFQQVLAHGWNVISRIYSKYGYQVEGDT